MARLILERLEDRIVPAGVGLVADIFNGVGSSSPNGLTTFNGMLFFAANDGVNGIELWKSDGTSTGTILLKDINVGAAGSEPTSFCVVGNWLYFIADDGIHGDELWRTDGTQAGTILLKDCNNHWTGSAIDQLTAHNGNLYFVASDGVAGKELWKSDGHPFGTQMVKDIYPGGQASNPYGLVSSSGFLYFSANDGTSGFELWKSDGTMPGTTMVHDVLPGPEGSFPRYFTPWANGRIYFSATGDGIGEELWSTNGQPNGLILVADLFVGPGSSSPRDLTPMGEDLLFSASNGDQPPSHGREIFIYNDQGLNLLKDINFFHPLRVVHSNPSNFVVIGGFRMVFAATTEARGREIWITDGTENGTLLLKDINNGPASSNPQSLTRARSYVYFAAANGVDGTELWRTDQTEAGTVLEKEIELGADGSYPLNLVVMDNHLYFTAYDGINGRELRRLPLPRPRIRGAAWNDQNQNGILDAGELPRAGAMVSLLNSTGAAIQSTTTDSEGKYSFSELTPGQYSVRFQSIPGFSFSPLNQGNDDFLDSDIDPLTGQSLLMVLLDGDSADDVNAGFYVQSGMNPTLSINDVTLAEGNAGTTNFTFTVSLSAASAQSVTVNYATMAGTAFSPGDFAAASGQLTFLPGETSKTITVAVVGDTTTEPDEQFFAQLTNPLNATLADGVGMGTITNDDAPAPTLSINNVTQAEGNAGTTNFNFTVTLSAASAQTVTVNYSTMPGSATSPGDFAAASGQLTFLPGETSKTITVAVVGDTTSETHETFAVNLLNPVNATIMQGVGAGTIQNDDAQIQIMNAGLMEGNAGTLTLYFTVTLLHPSVATVSVDYATADGGATLAGGDYQSAAGTLTFNPGDTLKNIAVPILGDLLVEPGEDFFVNLTNPLNAALFNSQGVGTIWNDDM